MSDSNPQEPAMTGQEPWQASIFSIQGPVTYWRVARNTQTIEEPGRYTEPAWIITSSTDARALAVYLNALEARLREAEEREQALEEQLRLRGSNLAYARIKLVDTKAELDARVTTLTTLLGQRDAKYAALEARLKEAEERGGSFEARASYGDSAYWLMKACIPYLTGDHQATALKWIKGFEEQGPFMHMPRDYAALDKVAGDFIAALHTRGGSCWACGEFTGYDSVQEVQGTAEHDERCRIGAVIAAYRATQEGR